LSQSLATVDVANRGERGGLRVEGSLFSAHLVPRMTARSCPPGGASKRGCDTFSKGTICRKKAVSRHGVVLQVEDSTEKNGCHNGLYQLLRSCARGPLGSFYSTTMTNLAGSATVNTMITLSCNSGGALGLFGGLFITHLTTLSSSQSTPSPPSLATQNFHPVFALTGDGCGKLKTRSASSGRSKTQIQF
jgi:hypothetical protein